MSICKINGIMPLRNPGCIQNFYDDEIKKSLIKNHCKEKGEKLNTEKFEEQKAVCVENVFYRLLQIKQREFNSEGLEKIENQLSMPFTKSMGEPNCSVSETNGFSNSMYNQCRASLGDKAAQFSDKFNRIKPLEDKFKNEDDLIERINTYYNHQKNLMDKYSEFFSDHGNEIASFIMKHWDTDKDGALSRDEAGITSDKMSQADTNGDGLIVEEELVASLEEVLLSDQKKIVAALSEKLNNSYKVHLSPVV